MFARVSIFNAAPEGLEKSLRIAQESVLPPLRGVEGSTGVIMLGDRQTGRSIGITLWQSEEAMRASEETATRLRTESAEAADEEIVAVERYEVMIEERWGS
ncbi:MAG TPA: hypothetical protein VGB64_03245 [Actinomycetota bacterium]